MNFICPQPDRWNEIYKKLCNEYERAINNEKGNSNFRLPQSVSDVYKAGGPPTPLILNGWWYSSDKEKSDKWIETIQWAARNNLEEYVSIDEKDKYYG